MQHGGQGDMHVTSSWDWIANFVAAGRQGVRSDTSGTGHTDNDPVLCASTCVSFGSIPGDQTQPHPHHHHRRCRMGRGHCRGGRLYCLLAGNWLSYQVIMHSMTKLSWNLYPANWLNVHVHQQSWIWISSSSVVEYEARRMLQMFIIMNSLEHGLARVALFSCDIEIFEMLICILECKLE